MRQDRSRRGYASRAGLCILGAGVALFGVGGCAGTQKSDRALLPQAVELFHHDLRWKYFQSMVQKVDPRFSGDLLDWLEKNKDELNVVGWEVYRLEPLPESDQMRAAVRISYFQIPSTVLKEEIVKQIWKDEGGRWILISQKGGPFAIPLLPEALPVPAASDGHDP